MGIFDTTQLGLEQAIGGAALRQRAIANNIANANTVGYKRVDVDFHDALDKALTGPGGKASADQRLHGRPAALVQVARARMVMLQIAMGTRQG